MIIKVPNSVLRLSSKPAPSLLSPGLPVLL